ncbi:hypothetical protein CONPUDRAFT_152114 [Coniophora puteana RWD-64-598 SS2]|uniref:Uncharacterized protein n=1 Tax=Coniophora puteana (strain RWD-64-598) TaxID=741705 RepID=A0A5M3MWU1_CONPW|nr:uncharacterized protein CONPUDRAFT_152114 [Coniophora puteana RWD-64-598 SS2]EIW83071.1 hypothetical protein CONPUDRAFT_152114 [Coniophora puteana RWD-64-598 SS2]
MSTDTTEIQPSSSSLLPRLSRSSSKAEATTEASSSTAIAQAPPAIPKAKLSAVNRFLRLARNGREEKVIFPPPSWFANDDVVPTTGSVTINEPQDLPAPGAGVPNTPPDNGTITPGNESDPETLEPETLARRIQAMIGLLPAAASSFSLTPRSPPTVTNPAEPDTPQPTAPSVASSSEPSLPFTVEASEQGTFTPATSVAPSAEDSRFIAFLSSASVMNGSLERGRQSVWEVLERLRQPSKKVAAPPTKTDGSPAPPLESGLEDIDDNSSVMFTAPLEPDASSEVEVAQSEIVSIDKNGEKSRRPENFAYAMYLKKLKGEALARARSRKGKETPSSSTIGPGSKPRSIPSSPLARSRSDASSGHSNSRTERSSTPSRSRTVRPAHSRSRTEIVPQKAPSADATNEKTNAPHTSLPQPKPSEYRVWIPSTTRVSLEATWWGFRIYLPPPVLDILNNKQLEAAKRAALITSALQWLIDHIPMAIIPPQFHPAVSILRRLAPYLGYLGGFVAWSWSKIKAFDKGFGVVLTATWLLPIALVPGTWEANEVPPESSAA